MVVAIFVQLAEELLVVVVVVFVLRLGPAVAAVVEVVALTTVGVK